VHYGLFSNKFTNLDVSVPAETRVRLNRETFMPAHQGSLSVANAVESLIKQFFSADEVTTQSWISTVIRDLLYCMIGRDMVKVGVTESYPSDGAGSGLGFGLRKAPYLFRHKVLMSNASFPLLFLNLYIKLKPKYGGTELHATFLKGLSSWLALTLLWLAT